MPTRDTTPAQSTACALPGTYRGGVQTPESDDTDDVPQKRLRRRPSLQVVLLLVIGALFGAFATLTWTVEPSARSVEGVIADIDPSGSAILLAEPEDLTDVGLGIVGVLWREGDGAWQRSVSPEGFPTCLRPDDIGRSVLLGLVTDPGGVGRPAAEAVAWLQCPPR